MENIVPSARAGIKFNEDFICIQTYAGYGSFRLDYKGVTHMLGPDASFHELGESLLEALAKSRFVLPEPRSDVWIHPDVSYDAELYDFNKTAVRYHEWVSGLMSKFGYANKRRLFKNMKSCSVQSELGVIKMLPSRHEKLEGWSRSGFKESDDVVISSDCSPLQAGEALRIALNRCM